MWGQHLGDRHGGPDSARAIMHVMAAAFATPAYPVTNPPSGGSCAPALEDLVASVSAGGHAPPTPADACTAGQQSGNAWRSTLCDTAAHHPTKWQNCCQAATQHQPPALCTQLHTAGVSTSTGASDAVRGATEGPNMCRSAVQVGSADCHQVGLTAAPDMAQSAGMGAMGLAVPGSTGIMSWFRCPAALVPGSPAGRHPLLQPAAAAQLTGPRGIATVCSR